MNRNDFKGRDGAMKKITLVAVIVLAASLAVPLASEADRGGHFRGGGFHHGGFHGHGHSHFVVGIGVGPFWGPYWGYPYWYYPPVAYGPGPVVVQEPPVYVQQQVAAPPPPPAPAAGPEQYWYYCESLKGYYPAVPNCPEQWMKVAPRP
jgi:hypothetical protein